MPYQKKKSTNKCYSDPIVLDSCTDLHQCDKARPQCAQCIRAKVQCQGYRSDLDLAFRDQTDQIISKTRRVLRSTNKDASAPLPSTIIPSPETSVTRSPSHMFLHDDKAILFFFDHFVMMRPGAIRSDTGFLLDIYRKAEPDDMFNHGVRALGYVLTSAPDEEQFGTVKAYSEYARALRLTSQAVSNVRALTMEKLMATVLLLSMFEVFFSIFASSYSLITFRQRLAPQSQIGKLQPST